MALMEVIVCASTNLFRIYIIHKFILIFLGDVERDRRKEILAGGIFFLVNTGTYLLFHSAGINVLCNLLGIGSMVFLYTKSIRTNLFVTCGIYLVAMACDTMPILLTGYKEGQRLSHMHHVIMVFLMLICELLVEKIISERKNMEKESLPLVLVLLSSIGLLLFIAYGRKRPDRELVVICLGLTLINFIVFYLYNMLLKALSQKYENKLLEQKVQIYSNQLYSMLESESRVKNLRHDMKHHLNGLKLLAAKEDLQSVQNYLDDMEGYLENPNEIVSTGNIETDSVLNYMLQMAKRELDTVDLKIQVPEMMSDSFDLNIILGNLLENAIEAARQTEKKYLSVIIQFKKGILRIEIENSFNGSLLFQKDDKNRIFHLETTKRDKRKHGIGLSSVRKIVAKYNGTMDTCVQNNRFCTKLILYIPEME